MHHSGTSPADAARWVADQWAQARIRNLDARQDAMDAVRAIDDDGAREVASEARRLIMGWS